MLIARPLTAFVARHRVIRKKQKNHAFLSKKQNTFGTRPLIRPIVCQKRVVPAVRTKREAACIVDQMVHCRPLVASSFFYAVDNGISFCLI